MVRMSAKKQQNPVDSVLNAAVGYTTILLGVVCFLIVLAITMAGVRIVMGASLTASTTPNQTAALTSEQSETA